MKENNEKAYFTRRLAAFILDIFIISMIASLISAPFLDSESITKLDSSAKEVVEKYSEGSIELNTYVDEAMSISYQLARKQGVVSIVTLALSILYFIVYQFYNKGQTIGKKLLKIKVVSSDDKELTTNNYVIRSLIINSILVDMINLAIIIFGNEQVYFYGLVVVWTIKYSLLLICALMVMFRKDGMGLHDKIAHTMVVNV